MARLIDVEQRGRLDRRWRLDLAERHRWRSTRWLERLAAARLLEVDQRWRLELLERQRRRLELVDRRANLSNSSKEDATRCLVWLGDLIDAKKLGGSAAGSDRLHLPVAGVATAGTTQINLPHSNIRSL